MVAPGTKIQFDGSFLRVLLVCCVKKLGFKNKTRDGHQSSVAVLNNAETADNKI